MASPYYVHQQKIAKGIGIILKARKVFDNETLFALYYTFVYPYLNYCIHVWGKTYDTHLHHLIILQNKVIRIINGVPPRTNVDNLYLMHDILSVKRLYSDNVALFMYKYSNQLLPDVFDNFFSKLADVHEYNTRNASAQHVYICFQRTTRGQKTLSYCGARIRNYVLDNVDSDCAIGLFKKRFQTMTYLHDSATFWCINASVLNLYKDVYTCICMCICVLLEVHILTYMCMRGRALN